MIYTPILATLGYVFSEDKQKVLMLHRNARPDDLHYGKYNGLGGKLKRGENVVSGLQREIKEEAGIDCDSVFLAGTISWPGFGIGGEDWFGFIFRVTQWHGIVTFQNREGTLEWVHIDDIMNLALWDGDRHFLPLVLSQDSDQFHGVMPYRNGRAVDWRCNVV